MAELVVYGRESCGFCRDFKELCCEEGLKYRDANIDVPANKAEMARKLRSTEWFKGGKFGLPLVDVYGSIHERPTVASVKAAREMLPSDEQVDNIKKQFKELDLNNDGTLSFNEMQKMMQGIAPSMSEIQLQKLFCAADVNQNGVLELNEFIDFVLHGKAAMAKIMQEPPETEPCPEAVREDWKERALLAHNWLRRRHGVLDLEWSDECYENAKRQADACQAAGRMLQGHCEGTSGRHGQNIYWNPCTCPHPNVIVESWYKEVQEPGYDFSKSLGSPETEHFTQVVWKRTTHAAMAVSEDGMFCVANYFPAGNLGSFKENVFPEGTAVPKPPRSHVALAKAKAAALRPKAVGKSKGKAKHLAEPEERIEKAFQEGADAVVIDRLEKPPQTHIRVITRKNGEILSQFRGTMGGG
ncbi:Golgi-associated plant pathogenesis-related protein 1 (GAPR-1) (Golgi-associated PR-1 protein) (Glioma pathogenesis-related protein 2) (GliPR 2) [Durusdinium trenchii]|uniref:Golgi-associated plant pathogenesis-related protein 1 (GAPR-1) (Golgi-associated PR-1 protein) (Glioma pathogenesis-related protein 2) (GliPR 2) n=1 Tax=Durusdinium trenchii TaxID=1381693 RepID=A0ABP0N5G9_9DINO